MALTTTVVNPNQTLAAGGLEGATDDVISAVYWNRLMNLIFAVFGTGGYIGCRASHGATQSINTTTNTAVLLNGEAFDSDPNGAIHDNVTLNSRLTCRTTGIYHVSGYVQWAFNATGYRRLYLRVNGTVEMAAVIQAAMAGDATDQTIFTSYALNATDYVELMVAQSSGGALSIAAGATLSMIKA